MNSSSIKIIRNSTIQPVKISLPASKSIANRALIIAALSGQNSLINNLSEARDTRTMQRLLGSDIPIWDVLDAGTTMRFLTALSAVTQPRTLTGTTRMKERPIKILADALTTLGARIEYLEQEGYPPIAVGPIEDQLTKNISVRGDISSQYISALLMIAPVLPYGLEIELTGHIGSKPYINTTLAVMRSYGVNAEWNDHIIYISQQRYIAKEYTVEPDWSAASYWYSFVALSESGEVLLEDLPDNSIQGDRKIADYMKLLGVHTTFTPEGALLTKCDHAPEVTFDFTDCPDMAQTVAVLCAAKGIKCTMSGLESLRIKETDRIYALQTELAKIGAELKEVNNEWLLTPVVGHWKEDIEFDTYHDHRMAMAFAPLSALSTVIIHDPVVVDKSYPRYWEDMEKAGFTISEL